MIKIWDLWIRLFHWSLAFSVLFLLFSGETGTGFFDWHKLIGEVALALIVFRLLWSVVGSSNASLISLVTSPGQALEHFRHLAKRSPQQERGHNAAGGWAVLGLLLLVLVQALTGLFIEDEEGWVSGEFNRYISSDTADFLYEVHHLNAHLLQALVIIHVVMVIIYLVYAKQNLIKPMITGMLRWEGDTKPADVRFGNPLVGLVLAIAVAVVFAYAIGWWPS